MGKVAVVYWSGTGNTKIMANEVAAGVKAAGGEVSVYDAVDFSVDLLDTYSGVAFGCPSMGAEILEEDEFQPMWDKVENKLAGKKVALFGSYDWGDGEWMRNWEETCKSNGITLACDFVICQLEPGDDTKSACQELGKALV